MKRKLTGNLTKKAIGIQSCCSSRKIQEDSQSHRKLHQYAIGFEASSTESVAGKRHHISTDRCTSTCHDMEDCDDIIGHENSLAGVPPLVTTSHLSETIFSPTLEAKECQWDAISYSFPVEEIENRAVPDLVSDDSDDNSNSWFCDMICHSESSHVTDAITACLSSNGNLQSDPLTFRSDYDYEFVWPDMTFDAPERPLMLPSFEEIAETNSRNDAEFTEASLSNPDDGCLFWAINQARSSQHHVGNFEDSDGMEYFDPFLFFSNFPDIADPIPLNLPILPATMLTHKAKPVTLVLDLDETLVHSSLEHSLDADFTFTIYFNMKEHTVYVRKRPHLQTFLERVAEMFETIIFTASDSIYAERLLNILDPDQKIISERLYRESCRFSGGNCMKDLTVLGRDLAKVAIIDHTPQVFQLQVDNGIPIQSWFDDPTDCELLSMLPFLETLASATDVRPFIAKQFGVQD